MLNTSKIEIQRLVKFCEDFGIVDAVIAPGSRNAPLTIAFNRSSKIQTKTVADERVAGFMALGMSLKSGKPTVLVCTSGSACLNFAPAIVEAYYQGVPMLVLTADRPLALLDNGHGQTINQSNVYANYIKGFFSIEEDLSDDFNNDEKIIEALLLTQTDNKGPVHLNVPMQEPLYDLIEEIQWSPLEFIPMVRSPLFSWMDVWQEYEQSAKVIAIAGQECQGDYQSYLYEVCQSQNIVLLTEATSNLEGEGVIHSIDRVLSSMDAQEQKYMAPDLVISFGGAVVSKKIKEYLNRIRPSFHWNVGVQSSKADTYEVLSQIINVSEREFLEQLSSKSKKAAVFLKKWSEVNSRSSIVHSSFMDSLPWSDYKVFELILNRIPSLTDVHLGNSTVVRYANLFDIGGRNKFFCNRGTSGIDGIASTAFGAQLTSVSDHSVATVITGDISFMYDSNALWHNYNKEANLKVILINNGGGAIFRIIPGPDQLEELETYFDCYSTVDVSAIAKGFGVGYRLAESAQELQRELDALYLNNEVEILEVRTKGDISAEVLRSYFKELKESR